MKLLARVIDKNGLGYVSLIANGPEDLWHTYQLLQEGDRVRTTTFRKVQTVSATGSTVSEKVKVTLTILVKRVDFTPEAELLRVNGINVTESDKVKVGAFHALDIECNRQFSIEKDFWDTVALERISLATDAAKTAEVAAVVLGDGIAHICLITDCMTVTRASIDTPIPRKRKASVTGHEKALSRFFESVLQAMIRHFDFSIVKCVIIASPGFVKDEFMEYMWAEVQKRDLTQLSSNRAKFLVAHSSSPHRCALKEVLEDPAVLAKIADTKAAGEVRTLNEFFQVLKADQYRAVYGLRYVKFAHERRAIKTLLVTDDLFRSCSIETRREYVQLVESVKAESGEVRVFSSLHVSGEQLGKLTGVAAILRYPLHEIDDLDADGGDENYDEEEEEEEERGTAKGSSDTLEGDFSGY
ncbi:protein pelota-like [Pelomyxa schiedti]|nr:protein pelota-like [Pelomyxa schiedti]